MDEAPGLRSRPQQIGVLQQPLSPEEPQIAASRRPEPIHPWLRPSTARPRWVICTTNLQEREKRLRFSCCSLRKLFDSISLADDCCGRSEAARSADAEAPPHRIGPVPFLYPPRTGLPNSGRTTRDGRSAGALLPRMPAVPLPGSAGKRPHVSNTRPRRLNAGVPWRARAMAPPGCGRAKRGRDG